MEIVDQGLYDILYKEVIVLLEKGQPTELILQQLRKKTEDPIIIAVVIKEAKKDYYALMRKDALARIAIGAILIVLGFLITAFNFHSNKSFSLAMYGLTSLGILFIFWGLYKLIG
jgi:hypothetical protein